jgi:hypothetical protein
MRKRKDEDMDAQVAAVISDLQRRSRSDDCPRKVRICLVATRKRPCEIVITGSGCSGQPSTFFDGMAWACGSRWSARTGSRCSAANLSLPVRVKVDLSFRSRQVPGWLSHSLRGPLLSYTKFGLPQRTDISLRPGWHGAPALFGEPGAMRRLLKHWQTQKRRCVAATMGRLRSGLWCFMLTACFEPTH